MQTRYHEYKRGLISIDENHRLLGIIKPGRYAGFDTVANVVGLTCEINHLQSGVIKTRADLTQTPPSGVFVTPQGSIINEDAPVNVLFDSNSGNPQSRADLIIYNHTHVTSPGGADALLTIVKGPIASFTLPALPNPATQIVIGIMVLPANATNLSSATYLPSTRPGIKNRIIEMYSGLPSSIPVGYTLCNGIGTDSQLNPIPDLRDRFIVGYNPGDSDYNLVGKLGPEPSITPDDYTLVGAGRKILMGAKNLANHKHTVDLTNGIKYGSGFGSIGSGSSGLGEQGNVLTGPIRDTLGMLISTQLPLENRPPFYTLAFIVPI